MLLADVRELRGERFGHMLDRSSADTVEERTEAVPSAQPRAFPKTGGERRTVTTKIFGYALKISHTKQLWSWLVNSLLCLHEMIMWVMFAYAPELSFQIKISV